MALASSSTLIECHPLISEILSYEVPLTLILKLETSGWEDPFTGEVEDDEAFFASQETTVVAVRDHHGGVGDLSFKRGDKITLIDDSDKVGGFFFFGVLFIF